MAFPQPTGGTVTAIPAINVTSPLTTTDIINSDVTGDTNDRFVVDADGTLRWGPGNAALSVQAGFSNIGGTGVFRVPQEVCAGSFKLTNETSAIQITSSGGNVTLDLNSYGGGGGMTRMISNSLDMQVGKVGPGGEAGALLGSTGDVNLYRSAANTLKTDDSMVVAGSLQGTTNVTARTGVAAETSMGNLGPANESAILLGSAGDTNLYRIAANKLATDDGLTLNNGALAGGANAAGTVYGGSGAPNNANGANGDIYIRTDGGALTTVYQRRAGAWVGIV